MLYTVFSLINDRNIPVTHRHVPIADMAITQPWLFENRLEDYLSGNRKAETAPMVWEWRGNLYLADGHHRTAASQRRGQTSIKAAIHHLPDSL